MKYTTLILILFLFSTVKTWSQTDAYAWRPFSFHLGAAPNVYINNLEMYSDQVHPLNYSFVSQMKWNSKYRLSFGLEVGYLQLYSATDFPDIDNLVVYKKAIPIMLNLEMRMYKGLYGSLGLGVSILLIQSASKEYSFHSNHLSLADLTASLGYRWFLSDRWNLAIEGKFYRSSKSVDMNIAIPVIVGYRF